MASLSGSPTRFSGFCAADCLRLSRPFWQWKLTRRDASTPTSALPPQSAGIFTNDAAFLIAGAERVARILAMWGGLLAKTGFQVSPNTYLGNQFIPADKVTRASAVLGDFLVAKPVEYGTYRSLMGRIGHLRGIAEADRTLQYHMHVPFAKGELHPWGHTVATLEIPERPGEGRARPLKYPGPTCARFMADRVMATPYFLADVQRAFHVFTNAALLGAQTAC